MTVDKRVVHTDALETLGLPIDASVEKRDAIHLAVEPVIAGVTVIPGQHAYRLPNGTYGSASTRNSDTLGLVDPFRENVIQPGQGFWLVLYPRTITSLRHVWVHPDFDTVADIPTASTNTVLDDAPLSLAERAINNVRDAKKEEARRWIRNYAEGLGLSYDELMDGAEAYIYSGKYLHKGGLLEGEWTADEFWENYNIIYGIDVNRQYGNFFSCSC